ncbi:MAG: aldehyde dehydrogenase family protein, partial [Bradymonadaceae bacterium]
METRGNYIDGNWETVKSAKGKIERENPAEPGETVFRTSWDLVSVDRAVESARKALPEWDRLGVEGRREYLEELIEAFNARREDIARAISREVGKPLWEARGEADALGKKIEIMADEGLEVTRERHPDGVHERRLHTRDRRGGHRHRRDTARLRLVHRARGRHRHRLRALREGVPRLPATHRPEPQRR